MNNRWMLETLLCSVLVACTQTGGAPVTTADEPADGGAGLVRPDAEDAGAAQDAGAQACVDSNGDCEPGVTACCDGYCLAGYVLGTCIPKAAMGEWCEADAMCASGRCSDGRCVHAECAELEQACFSDTDCCTGFCSGTALVYAPGQCVPRQASGTACTDDNQCHTRYCRGGACL